MSPVKHDLVLVTLNDEQIAKAKEANGYRKQITHALICGPHGQILGTEQQCLKYFSVWSPDNRFEVSPGQYRVMFPNLFRRAIRTSEYEIADYTTTFNLVNILIAADGNG